MRFDRLGSAIWATHGVLVTVGVVLSVAQHEPRGRLPYNLNIQSSEPCIWNLRVCYSEAYRGKAGIWILVLRRSGAAET